jgi:hypothetical protein
MGLNPMILRQSWPSRPTQLPALPSPQLPRERFSPDVDSSRASGANSGHLSTFRERVKRWVATPANQTSLHSLVKSVVLGGNVVDHVTRATRPDDVSP